MPALSRTNGRLGAPEGHRQMFQPIRPSDMAARLVIRPGGGSYSMISSVCTSIAHAAAWSPRAGVRS
jgi:hypothetical protein